MIIVNGTTLTLDQEETVRNALQSLGAYVAKEAQAPSAHAIFRPYLTSAAEVLALLDAP